MRTDRLHTRAAFAPSRGCTAAPDGLPRFSVPLAELGERVAQRRPQPLVQHFCQRPAHKERLQHVAAVAGCKGERGSASKLGRAVRQQVCGRTAGSGGGGSSPLEAASLLLARILVAATARLAGRWARASAAGCKLSGRVRHAAAMLTRL